MDAGNWVEAVLGLLTLLVSLLVVPEFRRRVGLDKLPEAVARVSGRIAAYTRSARQTVVRSLTARSPAPPAPEEATARPPSGWVLVHSRGCRSHGLPGGIRQRVDAARAHEPVKQFAYRGDAEGWLVLHGRNGFVGRNLPRDLRQHLAQANRMNQEIEQVAFGAQSGWLLLAGGAFVARGIPQALERKLLDYGREGRRVKRVALGPGSGWVVLLGRNGFRTQGVPGQLHAELAACNRAREEIKQVVLLPAGGWLALHGRNGFSSQHLPPEALAALEECRRNDLEILDLGFAWFGQPAPSNRDRRDGPGG